MSGRPSRLPDGVYRPTIAVVDLEQIARNFRALRDLGPTSRPVLAVVKADAYGHGAVPVARRLEAAGATVFGVALVEEGIALREGGVRSEILCLGGFQARAAEAILAHRLVPAVFDLRAAAALDRAAARRGRKVPVHLKIDTGMARLGVPMAALPEFLEGLGRCRRLQPKGIFTTLASGDDPSSAKAQIALLLRAAEAVQAAGHERPCIHAANSSALGAAIEPELDLARSGIALYGIGEGRLRDRVRPALCLESVVLQVKTLPRGATVGYRGTFKCDRPTVLATLPIGYDDGLPRALSNLGHVLIAGGRAPIVGAVSMDLTTVDVTDLPGIEVGERAVIIGALGRERIVAEQVAAWAGTIAYEILCGIGARVPRAYRSAPSRPRAAARPR